MAKYCSSCNTLSEDDSIKFCPACGGCEFTPAQPAPVIPDNAAVPETQAPVEPTTDPVAVQPQENVPAYGMDVEPPVEPVQKPKKKRLLKRLIIAGIAVAAAVAVALSPLPSLVAGYCVKVFGSDEQYLAFVENKALKEYTDSFVKWYDNYFKRVINRDASENIEIGIKLGKFPKTLLASRMGKEGGDLDWIEKAKFYYNANLKGDQYAYDAGLKIGGTDILSVLATLDMSDKVVLLGLKELSDDVLKIDLGEMENGLGMLSSGNVSAIWGAMPDGKIVRKLANKYFKIVTKNFKNASMSDETFEVGDITQKLTVIETKITEKFLYTAAMEVLKEAAKDKDIKKIVKDVEKAAEKSGLISGDEDLYTQFKSAIKSLREQLDNQIDDLDGNGKTLCVWYDYVDWTHEIVGHKVEQDGKTLGEFVELRKGKNIEFEANFADYVTFAGSGTEKSGKRNMSYDVEVVGVGKATVKLEDYKVNDVKKGKMEGILRILPDMDSFHIDLSEVSSEITPFLSVLKPELKVSFKIDEKSQEYDIDVLNSGALILGITAKSKTSDGKSVSEPKGDRYEAENEEDIKEFLSKLDLGALADNLKKAGLPSSLTDQIETLLENYGDMLKNGELFSGNMFDYEDDEDYEDYDDFEDYDDSEDYDDDYDDYDDGDYDDGDYDDGDYDIFEEDDDY